MYYIRDTTAKGDLVLWWRPQRSGYTSVLAQAGLYTEAEARDIHKIRGTDIPYPEETARKVSEAVVFQEDLQVFRSEYLGTWQRGEDPPQLLKSAWEGAQRDVQNITDREHHFFEVNAELRRRRGE